MISAFQLAVTVTGRRMSGKRVADEVRFALEHDWNCAQAVDVQFMHNDGTRRVLTVAVVSPDDVERSLRSYFSPDRGEWLANDDCSVIHFHHLSRMEVTK